MATVPLAALLAGGFTVLLVYVLLQHEYHRWQWMAFVAPATAGLYAFAVAICFFLWKGVPRDAYTALYFAATSAGLALVVGLVWGRAGVVAATAFVRLIFSNLKLD